MQRLLFIDMFRGFAVLVMLEGHVFNAMLAHPLRATKEFHYLNIFHGMIAPSFIFISGFAFALGLERKWDSFLKLEKPFWLQIRRLFFVLALAYWLHLPTWSFQGLLDQSRETILYFLRCDVLQLIALSLLFSLFVCVAIRNQKAVIFTVLVLALIIIFATPFVYYVDTRVYLPPLISDYINSKYRALFPIFPWAAFSFAGTVICWLYLKARAVNRERDLFKVLGVVGIIFFISAFILFYVPWQYHTYEDPARSSPRHFMMKTGFIFFSLAGLWFFEQRRKPQKSILNIVGQESLLVYGLHLVIVYGASFTPRYMSKDIGPVLTFGTAFAVTWMLAAVMILSALGWHWLKQKHPRVAKSVFYGLCAVYFIKFFAT